MAARNEGITPYSMARMGPGMLGLLFEAPAVGGGHGCAWQIP